MIQAVTTNVSFDISDYFNASDVDTGETPTVDESSVSITATTSSSTTNAAPFVVQGTGNSAAVVVETGNYDFLAAGEFGIFDVSYNIVSDSDTVSESFTITINGQNDAPEVVAGGTLSFQHGIGAQQLDPTLTATDVDTNDQMVGATVTIQGFTSGDGDLLNFVNQGSIAGSYDNTTGVLTLTGAGTVAEYQTALASVTYNTTDLPSSAETRTIEWVLNDGDATSTTVTSTINIPAINQVLGADIFSGTIGSDFLTGSNLDDNIDGLADDDIIFGGNGQDTMMGGAGSDVFVMDASSIDTILDLDVSEDYVDISNVVGSSFDPNNDITFNMNGANLEMNVDNGSGGSNTIVFSTSVPTNGELINIVYDPTAEAIQVAVGLGTA